ncbi:MAG: ribosome recycling factor [Dehalococcoidia bacterium]|nr:ribosome recycling factor [Dehalococcoidia bacterium]
MIEQSLTEADDKMKKAIEALRRELVSIRTGRAAPGLVDHLLVDYYSTLTPLNQLASITAPEVRLILIQPWDRSSLQAIEKAILKSDLGLNPSNDGQVIRLALPQLTEERRKDLVKVVHKKVEEGRVSVRNVRRDAVDHLKKQEKDKLISADDLHRTHEKLQKLTDKYIVEVDHVGQDKEAELMEV